jgi:hypothetical protein
MNQNNINEHLQIRYNLSNNLIFSYKDLKYLYVNHTNITNFNKLTIIKYTIINLAGNTFIMNNETLINIIINIIDNYAGYSFQIVQNNNVIVSIYIDKTYETIPKFIINYNELNETDDLNIIILPSLFNNILNNSTIKTKLINDFNSMLKDLHESIIMCLTMCTLNNIIIVISTLNPLELLDKNEEYLKISIQIIDKNIIKYYKIPFNFTETIEESDLLNLLRRPLSLYSYENLDD